MKIKLQNFLKKIWKNPFVWAGVVALVTTSFLAHHGIWLYQDIMYDAKTAQEAWYHIYRFFSVSAISDYYQTFWGYNAISFQAGRLTYLIFLTLAVVLHSASLAQYIHYVVFVFLSFLVNYYFLLIFTKKQNLGTFIGALFFVTSQFFLYFFDLPGFFYVIIGFQVFMITGHGILTYPFRIRYVFLLAVSGYLLVSYQRFTILFAFLTLIVLVYNLRLIAKNIKKVGLYLLCTLPLVIPIVFVVLSTLVGGTGISDATSYQQYFGDANGPSSYLSQLHHSIISSFTFNAPSSSFLNTDNAFYNQLYYIFSIAISAAVMWRLTKSKENKKLHIVLACIYFATIFFLNIAHFVSQQTFIAISFTYFPTITNTTSYLRLLTVGVASVVLSLWYEELTTKRKRVAFAVLFISFCIISALPTFFFSSPKKEKIRLSDYPLSYNYSFFRVRSLEGMIYLPNSLRGAEDYFGLYADVAPYPIEPSQNLSYVDLMTNNHRLADAEQTSLFTAVNNNFGSYNNRFLGLKDVFVFHDVRNASPTQFDYYTSNRDYVGKAKIDYRLLRTNKNFSVRLETPEFTQFRFKDADNFDYTVYSPNQIVQTSASDFYKEKALNSLSLFIDPNVLPDSTIENLNNSLPEAETKLEIKAPNLNRNYYYIKASNINSESSLLLQLNQTFESSLKIKQINKADFDSVACSTANKNYSMTNNTLCYIKEVVLPLREIKYLFSRDVDAQHFKGNFIGNAWEIKKPGIVADNRGDAYVLIINENQILFSLVWLVAGVSLVVLLVVALVVFLSKFIRKGAKASEQHLTE